MFWLPFLAVSAIAGAATYVTAKSNQAAAQDQQERANEEQRRVDAANLAENLRAEAENERIAEANRAMARQYAETDFAGRLVSESEAAGFNPLTVMRAGGLSAYTSAYNTASANSVQSPTAQPYYRNPTPQTFIPNTGMAVGSAFSAAANVMAGAVTQNASNIQSRDLLQMQLSHASAERMAQVGVTRAGSGALASRQSQAAVLAGLPSAWDAGDVTVTDYQNPNLGRGRGTDPSIPDTEMRETRSGEIIANLIGFRTEIDDFIYRATGTTLQQRIQRRQANEANYLSAISNFTGGLSRWWNSRDAGNTSSPHFGNFQPGMGAW